MDLGINQAQQVYYEMLVYSASKSISEEGGTRLDIV